MKGARGIFFYQVLMDAWKQHHISEREVKPLGEHMLQFWQLSGLHFPYIRALSGGGNRWSSINRQLGQSCTHLHSTLALVQRILLLAIRWLRVPLRVLPRVLLLLKLVTTEFIIIVHLDRFGQAVLQLEKSRRKMESRLSRVT